MSDILQEIKEKIKSVLRDRETFIAILLVLVATASFGLGRQSVDSVVPEIKELKASTVEAVPKEAIKEVSAPIDGGTYYVASKNGEVYHLPYCSGAKRISEKNKVTYKTKAEAEAAGLRPAANCPGI